MPDNGRAVCEYSAYCKNVIDRKDLVFMSNRYCAINAKIKAMYSGCLKKEDYMALLSKSSVPEVCAILRENTSYSDVLEELTEDKLHRGNIEKNVLHHKMFTQYIRLYNFMNREERNIFRFWFMRNEIEFLKHRLRYILNNEPAGEEFENIDDSVFFEEHTKINCKLAMNARRLSDFLPACENTPYYDILRTAESIKSDYFSIVMMFDRLYYTMLWKAKDKLPKAEAKVFEEFVGSSIDMLNLMWIYRGKKYFDFDNEIIYTYLIPVRYRLSSEDIKSMVSASSDAGVLNYVRDSGYRELFEGVGEGFFVEENYHRLELKLAKKIFVTNPMTMAAVFAYFQIKQTEVYNITTIIECVRYGIKPEIIKKHVRV
ncbi:MAG: V-type ATPase subunit [Clostridia bacterium]|nr:V-type ATPase subunit [Clostridia bacterium]